MTVSRVSMTLSEPVAKRTETAGACKAILESASGRGRERVLQSTRGVKRIGDANDVGWCRDEMSLDGRGRLDCDADGISWIRADDRMELTTLTTHGQVDPCALGRPGVTLPISA